MGPACSPDLRARVLIGGAVIGAPSVVSADQARVEAKKALREISSGDDPSREPREARAIALFRAFSDR